MHARHVLGALLVLAGAATAAAEPRVAFSAPGRGSVLRAGEEVEIRWSGAPDRAEEMELLLSLDGGERIALRLTSELPASDRTFAWRVPNLASGTAALLLRVGEEGREVVAAVSAPFTILPDRGLERESLELRSGELWIASAGAVQDPLAPPALAGDAERVERSRLPADVPAAPVRAAALEVGPAASPIGVASRPTARLRGRPPEPPPSASLPLRI